MTKEDFVTASALATYVFCPYAWWLSRKYGVIETKAMREGNYLHSPLILTLTERALEERGYGKPIYCGHKSHYPTLYSKNYKLIGRPDYIMSTGKVLVPVELKSSPAPENPYFSHIMQLIAYCVLTEENYKLPEYGLRVFEI
jgi:CRISPR-associated protein Cas4